MKTLDVQARLEYGRAAVAVLRALKIANSTMRYGEFAKAIGLMADGEDWQPWHRQQIGDILNLIAATERQAGQHTGVDLLEFDRIVTAQAEPGAGFIGAAGSSGNEGWALIFGQNPRMPKIHRFWAIDGVHLCDFNGLLRRKWNSRRRRNGSKPSFADDGYGWRYGNGKSMATIRKGLCRDKKALWLRYSPYCRFQETPTRVCGLEHPKDARIFTRISISHWA